MSHPRHTYALTERELILAYHVYRGKDNIEISMAMGNGRNTVRNNLSRVYGKLGFETKNGRVELATWFARQVMRSALIEEGYVYLTGEIGDETS